MQTIQNQQTQQALTLIEGLDIPEDQKALLLNVVNQVKFSNGAAFQTMQYSQLGMRSPLSRSMMTPSANQPDECLFGVRLTDQANKKVVMLPNSILYPRVVYNKVPTSVLKVTSEDYKTLPKNLLSHVNLVESFGCSVRGQNCCSDLRGIVCFVNLDDVLTLCMLPICYACATGKWEYNIGPYNYLFLFNDTMQAEAVHLTKLMTTKLPSL